MEACSKHRHIRTAGLAFGALLLAAACGSAGPEDPGSAIAGELDGAPSWVGQGCDTAFEGRKVVCGVGSAGGSRSISILRTGAMARGRTEIARTLNVRVKAMIKDYQSTSTAGELFSKSANDEQLIEDVSKQVTDRTLVGTVLEKTWVSKRGTYFALMSLDLGSFLQGLQSLDGIDAKLRDAIETRAARAFEELERGAGSEKE
jgi:hypothetical protein